MSSIEKSNAKLESDIERPIFRPQRPPPPPPPPPPTSSIQTESSISMELTRLSSETEVPEISTNEIPDETNQDDVVQQSTILLKFQNLFDSFDYEMIRNKILNREMVTSPFTTVLWRIFLHCLPRDSSQWSQVIDGSRADYDELVNKYLLDLGKIRESNDNSISLNHPLCQDDESPWHQYYLYEELKDNINQDVRRTCQDMSFFRQEYILKLLLDVLYIHSRHYGEALPYRQGMHEILAVIVYLLHLESVTVSEYPESNEIMKKLYDPKYLAHDAFGIYEKIMDHLQPFYDYKATNIPSRNNVNMNANKQILFKRANDMHILMNDTVMRVNSIFERLKHYDLPLYERIQNLKIEPTVYGIRWLRLLFGREIPFGAIPGLWTVIFCYDEYFRFVDYFFLALLMDIGKKFGKNNQYEYSNCLQCLMQPNDVSDVESIIQNALNLEKISRTKEFRGTSSYVGSSGNRSSVLESPKLNTSEQIFTQNPIAELIKNNSTNRLFSTLQSSKYISSCSLRDSEMLLFPGRETRERLKENVQQQQCCGEFINKFIFQMQSRICDLRPINEDQILIQLEGLKLIANVLEGKLMLEEDSLQDLLNYECKEIPTENDTNDII